MVGNVKKKIKGWSRAGGLGKRKAGEKHAGGRMAGYFWHSTGESLQMYESVIAIEQIMFKSYIDATIFWYI